MGDESKSWGDRGELGSTGLTLWALWELSKIRC